MNKRQRKKKLKQQTKVHVSAKQREQEKIAVPSGKQPESEAMMIASDRQQKKLGNLLQFALFPIIFLIDALRI